MKNLMDEYIHFTEKKINKYVKWILGKKYNQEITEEFMKTYINARYYNIVNSEKRARAFYQRILNELKYKENIINKKLEIYNIEDGNIVKYTKKIFSYMLFFDNVRNIENFKNIDSLKEIVEKLSEIKYKIEQSKSDKEFEKKLYNEIKNDIVEKEILLDNIEDDELYLEVNGMKNYNNIYKVSIHHNIKMPMQYSEEIIEKVFNSGIIAEDKIEIEYILLSLIVVKDVIDGEFGDTYIAEFVPSILKKEQKTKSILSRINNQALQDKIVFNIMYEDLIKYRKKITELTKNGYNFAITLDNSMENADEMMNLTMFRYIIIPKDLKKYNEIIKHKEEFGNIIEE
jgi:hypothetical protein